MEESGYPLLLEASEGIDLQIGVSKSIVYSIAKDLKCPICLGLLSNPVALDCCVNRFCKECIMKYLHQMSSNAGQRRKCPMCKNFTSHRKTTEDQKLNMLVTLIKPMCEESLESELQSHMIQANIRHNEQVNNMLNRRYQIHKKSDITSIRETRKRKRKVPPPPTSLSETRYEAIHPLPSSVYTPSKISFQFTRHPNETILPLIFPQLVAYDNVTIDHLIEYILWVYRISTTPSPLQTAVTISNQSSSPSPSPRITTASNIIPLTKTATISTNHNNENIHIDNIYQEAVTVSNIYVMIPDPQNQVYMKLNKTSTTLYYIQRYCTRKQLPLHLVYQLHRP